VFAFGVALISIPGRTEATPLGAPTVNIPNLALNQTTGITAIYNDDTLAGSGSAVLAVSPAIGTFLAGGTVTPANGEVVTVSGATVTVTEDADTLPMTKQINAVFQCTIPGIATATLTHGTGGGQTSPQSVTIICAGGGFNPGTPYGFFGGFPYAQYPGYPTNTYPTSFSTATNVTVSASPASTTCTSPSTISVTLKDANGILSPDGTSVTVSASTGTVSPNVVSTIGGYATTTFMAPNNSNGTATVTASSGQGTGYATVSFSCTGAITTVPSAPAAPVFPPAVQPTFGGTSVILPPNTGDAGLAAQGHTTSYAGLALVTLSVIGLGAGVYSLRHQRIER